MSDGLPNATTWRWTAKAETAALALAEGKSWEAIKDEFGIAKSTLARWTKEPEFQARIAEHVDAIVEDARRLLRQHATTAAKKMIALLDSDTRDDAVAFNAAKDMLDRAGLKPPDRHELTGAHGAPLFKVYQSDGDFDPDSA